MAFSKIYANISLFRTLPILTDQTSRLLQFRTCGFGLCRQKYNAAHYEQWKSISTSLSCYNRFTGTKNIILSSRLKDVGKIAPFKESEQQIRLKSSLSKKSITKNGGKNVRKNSGKNGNDEVKKEGIIQRFKKAYKEHGKILVGVHVATSIVWLGSFWYTVHVGVDVVGFLERIGISERILNPMRNSGAGDLAVAYLMYKLATPARYTVTLAGTNYAIKHLRKMGKMAPQKEKMRDLVRDSSKALKTKGEMSKIGGKLNTIRRNNRKRVIKLRNKSKHRMVQLRQKSKRRLVQLRNFFLSTRKK